MKGFVVTKIKMYVLKTSKMFNFPKLSYSLPKIVSNRENVIQEESCYFIAQI